MTSSGQRTIQVAIYTRAGWLKGTIHVGIEQPLIEELNEGGNFFRLTDVQLPFEEHSRHFFAVHARDGAMVIPLDTAEQTATRQPPDGTQRHQIVCLLQEGTLLSHVDIPIGLRLSDYLLEQDAFIPIRECTVPVMELPTTVVEPIPIAYLNMKRVIGVTETDAMTADLGDDSEDHTSFTEA